jgi:hypothetical protein
MALAVIGGVIVSSGLTLFAVPAFYHLLDSWLGHHREKFERTYAEAMAAPSAGAAGTASPASIDPAR